MKRKILIFSFLLLVSASVFNVHSQSRRNELRLGVGIFSTSQFIDAFSDVIISTIPTGTTVQNGSSIGAWQAGYRYLLTDRWAVGGSFIFDYETADAIRNISGFGDTKIGDFKRFHYTLGAEADFSYIAREKFAFYSSLGIGATLYHQTYRQEGATNTDSDDLIHFNFQVTPIGLKFGNVWGGFLELGFGYKGIISLGLFCRL